MDPDSLLHAHRKILLDALRNPNQTAPPQTQTQTPSQNTPPPPAYTPTATHPHPLPYPTTTTLLSLPHVTNNTDFNDDDDDDDLPPPPPPPVTIKIDSTIKIVGHGNVLAYSPTETATRVAAMLVAALRQAKVLEGGEPRPVEISVGAGVSVVGCRNVLGATGVRGPGKGVENEAGGEPKGQKEGAESGGGDGGGRKRSAEEDSVEMPQRKKVEM